MKTTTTPSGTGRARLGLIVSMTVFGTIGLFVRRIEITSAELALCRAGLAAVFLLLYFLVTRRHLRLSEIKKSLWLLLASGAAMGINWMLLFEAYKYTTISLATLSYYLAPVLVTALCPLLFHERMTRTQLLCFLIHLCHECLLAAADLFRQSSHRVIGRSNAYALEQVLHAHRLAFLEIDLRAAHACCRGTGAHHVAHLQRSGMQLFKDEQQAHHLRHGCRIHAFVFLTRIQLTTGRRFDQAH